MNARSISNVLFTSVNDVKIVWLPKKETDFFLEKLLHNDFLFKFRFEF